MSVHSRWLKKYDTARGWAAKWRQRYVWNPTKHNKYKLEQWRQKAGYARRVLKRNPAGHDLSGANSFGIDWAWGTPDIPAMAKSGVKFACRYLSMDSGKNLTRAQAKALADHNIDCVVVWETTANRALAGHSAGVADAMKAASLAKACGKPVNSPIYFAVDFDETVAQSKDVARYFQGVNTVLGKGRTGAYGGYYAIKRLFDAGLIEYGWQTYAWSGGKWDDRAQLRQYSNGHRLANVSCDYNRSTHADFGQWRPV